MNRKVDGPAKHAAYRISHPNGFFTQLARILTMDPLPINDQLVIPATQLQASFARSSGPGGQNVNKVNSKATLHWELSQSQVLSGPAKARFKILAGHRYLLDGNVRITCQVHRDQLANLKSCREQLQQLVRQALRPPKPRLPTRPTAGSKRRRLDAKQRQADKKQLRRSPPAGE